MTDQPESTLERIARVIDPPAWLHDDPPAGLPLHPNVVYRRKKAREKARAVAEAPPAEAVIEAMARAIDPNGTSPHQSYRKARAVAKAQAAAILKGE